MRYTVILSPDPDAGGYSVSCPALPGALSEGASREKAIANIREAVELWLEVARERREAIPDEPPETLIDGLAVALAHRQELGWDTTLETAVVNIELAAVA